MTAAGKRLLKAAHEALAIANGEADPATYVVHAPPAMVDVKAIRTGMNMTQKVFGMRFGFGMARVRDWEQGRTMPAASDRVLLTTIQREPDAVLRALQPVEYQLVSGKDIDVVGQFVGVNQFKILDVKHVEHVDAPLPRKPKARSVVRPRLSTGRVPHMTVE